MTLNVLKVTKVNSVECVCNRLKIRFTQDQVQLNANNANHLLSNFYNYLVYLYFSCSMSVILSSKFLILINVIVHWWKMQKEISLKLCLSEFWQITFKLLCLWKISICIGHHKYKMFWAIFHMLAAHKKSYSLLIVSTIN